MGRPAVPEDLARHECLIYQRPPDRDQWRFRVGRQTVTVFPQGRFLADSGEALLQAAIAGLGIAALPTFLAAAAIESGAVVPLLTSFPMPEGGLYVVRPPGSNVPGKLRVLIDLLVERFGGEPYWDACAMRQANPAMA
jgi:DNA-binding transcriptional LysR family regulator